jgi:hypothetical protein
MIPRLPSNNEKDFWNEADTNLSKISDDKCFHNWNLVRGEHTVGCKRCGINIGFDSRNVNEERREIAIGRNVIKF